MKVRHEQADAPVPQERMCRFTAAFLRLTLQLYPRMVLRSSDEREPLPITRERDGRRAE
jgi:hypothetical protein